MSEVTKRNVVAVSTSKEINQFIVDNHKTMGEKEIAEHFGVTPKSINCRIDRLRKKAVIPPSKGSKRDTGKVMQSIDDAYNHLSRKKALTNEQIQNFIIANYGEITNSEIATNLGIESKKISGNIAALKRSGKLGETKATPKAKKVVAQKNTYSNADGENKQLARIKMDNGVFISGVTGTVLTLPHIGCTIERMILARMPKMNFIGCEIDRATYNAMNATIRKQNLPIESYFGAISDKIYGADSETYAHMILDYCGMITTFDKELRYVFQNDLVKVGGTISVTFSKRGHHNPNNIIKQLANVKSNSKDTRTEMEIGVEAYFNRLIGWNYAIEEIFNYKDNGKGAMMLVRIKRIK